MSDLTVIPPMGNPLTKALIVVDVQQGFINQYTEDAVPLINGYISQHRNEYTTLVATKFINSPVSPFARYLNYHKMMPQQPDTAIAFDTQGFYVVSKHEYSDPETLFQVIYESEIDICGFDTEACVYLTAAGLFDKGYKVNVLYDLCRSSGGEEYHRAALPLLQRTIGSVVRS